MSLPIRNIKNVAESHLCCGCGACAYACPDEIEMVDVLEHGRRPIVKAGAEERTADALKVCPGIGLEHRFDSTAPDLLKDLEPAWGPVLEVWEGYASDDAVRFAGSSGGAATALALYCLGEGAMYGVLHIAARDDVPYLNKTVLSRTREELLAATGSRYAPASPCDGLALVENAPSPCVFIGKPCDVAATTKARALHSGLDRNLGLTIGIFCAGTPSTRGTLEMFKHMGIPDPSAITHVRYRGKGWPGNAEVRYRKADGTEGIKELTYAQSWGEILERHRQWRCYVCVDHTAEFADIAVGDPWYRPIPPGEPGRSLILVRTERGRKIFRAAMAAGYLVAERSDPRIVESSQIGFPTVRGSVWARIWTCRLAGVPAPRFVNMPMLRFWLKRLSLKEKAQSIWGTLKRILRKRLYEPEQCVPFIPTIKSAGAAAVDCCAQSDAA